MPKKPNISSERIADAVAKAEELFFELQDIAEEIRAGRCDEITDLPERVRSLINLTRVAADASGALLYRQAMVTDHENLRKTFEARLAETRTV